MGTAIASGALILSANAQKMYQGLDTAGTKIKSWSEKTAAAGSKNLDKMGSNIKTGVGLGIGAALGGAAVNGVKSLIGSFGELAESITKSKSEAAALGTSSQTLQALGYAAKSSGASAEDLSGVLKDMTKNVSEASLGNTDLAATFNKIGLNANNLKNLSLEDQFGTVADALQTISNPADKTALSMKLLGDGGLKLGGLMAKGSAGINDLKSEATKLGVVLNDVDSDKVQQAGKAMSKLQAVGQGLFNRLLVAASPVIEMVGTKLLKAFDRLSPTITYVVDLISTYYEVMSEVWSEIFDGIGEIVSGIMDWVSSWSILENKSLSARNVILGVLKGVGIGLAYVYDTMKAGAGVVAIGISYLIDGFKMLTDGFAGVVSLMKKLPDNLRPAGLDSFIDGVDEFAKGVDQASEKTKLWGERQIDAFGKSAESVRQWFDRFDKEKAKANNKDLKLNNKDNSPATYTAVGAMLAGSRESFSLIARHQFSNLIKPEKDKNVELNKIQNKILEDIKDNTRHALKLMPW